MDTENTSYSIMIERDEYITSLVQEQLKFVGTNEQLLQYFQENRNRILGSRIVNWREIDSNICRRFPSITKIDSRRRFVKYILPSHIPQYPEELQIQILYFIQELLGQNEFNNPVLLKRAILSQVNQQFKLSESDSFSFVNQQMKNLHTVNEMQNLDQIEQLYDVESSNSNVQDVFEEQEESDAELRLAMQFSLWENNPKAYAQNDLDEIE
ncbi:Hypothetical_protein [Hexamita inflata]|uniref:Hypothetical_protein n=1 Tax=Hexamita inflata TaxID=28002 RepID=A0AA86UGV3_9EUKA|nr:Hypothetical protein HINF_LOCUS27498 [Hexamita inflata]